MTYNLILDTSAATDGKHVIIGMLIVGLVFLAVIALGELVHSANHKRAARRPPPY